MNQRTESWKKEYSSTEILYVSTSCSMVGYRRGNTQYSDISIRKTAGRIRFPNPGRSIICRSMGKDAAQRGAPLILQRAYWFLRSGLKNTAT